MVSLLLWVRVKCLYQRNESDLLVRTRGNIRISSLSLLTACETLLGGLNLIRSVKIKRLNYEEGFLSI